MAELTGTDVLAGRIRGYPLPALPDDPNELRNLIADIVDVAVDHLGRLGASMLDRSTNGHLCAIALTEALLGRHTRAHPQLMPDTLLEASDALLAAAGLHAALLRETYGDQAPEALQAQREHVLDVAATHRERNEQ